MLLKSRRIRIVLDIDHTLLNSAIFDEIDHETMQRLQMIYSQQVAMPPPGGQELFRFDEIRMWTKLRPGVRHFLKEIWKLGELWIHTNGVSWYAEAVVKTCLDPMGELIGDRIIAQGGDMAKSLEKGSEAFTIVIDDTIGVWQGHIENLVETTRYDYFPTSASRQKKQGRSIVETGRDENEHSGMLSIILGNIRRIHSLFFHEIENVLHLQCTTKNSVNRNEQPGVLGGSVPLWDVRSVVATLKSSILHGVGIVFSRVIELGSDHSNHPLVLKAQQCGARVFKNLEDSPGEVTHLVAAADGSHKAIRARQLGLYIVSPAWLYASCTLWKRQDESRFPPVQPQC